MTPTQIAHYQVIRKLSSGGMGEVYLGEDPKLGRKVAIKLLRVKEGEGSQGEARLIKEAQAAAQLDHPNVCAIFEVGESEEGPYIAMQYIEGDTLAEVLRRSRPTLHELLLWGIQTADALADAHARGIVHRDIKPANLMITPKGQVKVLDFGLAKMTKRAPTLETVSTMLTTPGLVMGTVPYMSPEQVRGELLDGRTDVFSLGSVLFEAAMGRRPFPASHPADLMSEILMKDPFADLPEGAMDPVLRAVLVRALDKDAGQRYPSAAAFADDLRRAWEHHRGPSGPILGDPTRTGGWSSGSSRGDLPTAAVPSSGFPAHGPRSPRLPPWLIPAAAAALVVPIAAYVWHQAQARQGAIDSLAVLPIANATGDAAVDYVADGLTEDLILQLSRAKNLRVIARSSVLRYKGKEVDPRTIASELGVRALLMGRLVKRGGEVSLNLELVHAADERHLWGDQIARPLDDLQTAEFAVASAVSLNLGVKGAEAPRRADREAYQLYLQGRYHAAIFSPDHFEKAQSYFDEALRKDPSLALAHIGKATVYFQSASVFKASGEVYPLARLHAEKAMALDPRLGEAHSLLGACRRVLDLDRAGAEAQYRGAVEFSPGSANVHHMLGYFLLWEGRQEEARKALGKALELDPFSSMYQALLGYSCHLEGNQAKAETCLRKAVELDRENALAITWLAVVLDLQGKSREAKPFWEQALKSGSPYAEALFGHQKGREGDLSEAGQLAQAMESRLGRPDTGLYVSPFFPAIIYAGTKEWDKAFAWVEKSIAQRDEMLITLKTDPIWKPVQNHPRFQALLKQAGD